MRTHVQTDNCSPLRRILANASGAALIATSAMIMLSTASASAATSATTCRGGGPTCEHRFSFSGSSGRQVQITVDLPGTATFDVRWYMYKPNGSANCYGVYTEKDPPRTWYCNLYGAGTYRIDTPNVAGGYIETTM